MSWPGKLHPWLRKIFFSDESKQNGELARLELRRMSHGSPESCVETWRFDEETPKVDIDVLAQEICQRCQDDSDESLDHITKYIVLAYYENYEFSSSQSPPALFRSTRQTDEFEGSEPATAKGLTTQLMRHTEALTRLVVANNAQNQSHMERLLAKAFDRIEELETDRVEAIRLVEQISTDAHTREIEGKREVAKIARQQEAWDSAKVLLPTVVNRLAGKQLLPTKTTPEGEIIHNLIGSLTKEQVADFAKLLNPMQLAGFYELYEMEARKHEERKKETEARAAKVDAAANGGQNGTN